MLDSQEFMQSDNVDEQWFPAALTESTQPDAATQPQGISSSEPRRSSRIRHPPNHFLPDNN